MISPWETEKLTSFTAVTPENVFTRWETAIADGSWSVMDTTGSKRRRYPDLSLIQVSLLKCDFARPETLRAAALATQKEGPLVVDADNRARMPPPRLKHGRAPAPQDIEAVP